VTLETHNIQVPDNQDGNAPHQTADTCLMGQLCLQTFSIVPGSIEPVGEGSNDCRAFKINLGGRWIKGYQCENSERANMVRLATEVLQRCEIPIPTIYAVSGNVVFAEWITGKPLSTAAFRKSLSQVVSYQARIHQAPLTEEERKGAGLLHPKWLLDRLRKASQRYIESESLERVAESVANLAPPDLAIRVMHPDFIRPNMVLTPSGELVVVDNEFLGIGSGFEFDILNASRVHASGSPDSQQRYLDAYVEVGDRGSLTEHRKFWDLCYLTKLAGKRLAMEDFEIGTVCFELLQRKVAEYAHQG
jgi:hypothetical protein